MCLVNRRSLLKLHMFLLACHSFPYAGHRIRGNQADSMEARQLEEDDIRQELGMDTKSIDVLTKTIRDEKFWAYATMVHTLNSLSEEFTSWAGGCPCHGWLHPAREQGRAQHSVEAGSLQACRTHLGLPPHEGDGIHVLPCPMAGLRAMELTTRATDKRL